MQPENNPQSNLKQAPETLRREVEQLNDQFELTRDYDGPEPPPETLNHLMAQMNVRLVSIGQQLHHRYAEQRDRETAEQKAIEQQSVEYEREKAGRSQERWSRKDWQEARDLLYSEELLEKEKDDRIYIEFLSPSQIMKYQPAPDLVLIGDYHLVRGTVVVVGGPPGVGKSRSLLALAEAGATKLYWFGLQTHIQFKTLVIQNENGLFRLQREIAEIDEPRLEQYLRVCPPPPYGMCFWKEGFRDQLKKAVDEFGPQAVALDPWNAIARDERAKDYLETFDIIRQVFPQGEAGPVIIVAAHTRKPTVGERANGRALLNLLAGSYVLGSVPRVVFVMQHASDEVTEDRVVWTCCKNNDGELGIRTAWVRQNGIFTPVDNFDWKSWDEGEKEDVFTFEQIVGIFEKNGDALAQSFLAKKIIEQGVARRTAYRRIDEAEKSGLIKFQKGKKVYVLSK